MADNIDTAIVEIDNKPAKHPGGRPLKYKTAEEMQVVIDRYFARCEQTGEHLTVSALAYELGMTRQQLIDYSDRSSEFLDAIKKAKSRIESALEEYILTARNPAGAIFVAKNNYGWKDKQEIDTNLHVDVAAELQKARERAKLISD